MIKNRLKEILKERKLTHQKAAVLIDTYTCHLTQIINSHNVPNLRLAMKIAAAFGMKVDDIWYFDNVKGGE